MAKYLVETYYNCTFKVSHYLDEVNNDELKNLEKRDDGKFEIIDVKLDNRKTKNLDKISKISEDNKQDPAKIDNLSEVKATALKNNISSLKINNAVENNNKRFGMPDRRKGYIQKVQLLETIKSTFILESMKMEK